MRLRLLAKIHAFFASRTWQTKRRTNAKSPHDDHIVQASKFWFCAAVNAGDNHNLRMRDLWGDLICHQAYCPSGLHQGNA